MKVCEKERRMRVEYACEMLAFKNQTKYKNSTVHKMFEIFIEKPFVSNCSRSGVCDSSGWLKKVFT